MKSLGIISLLLLMSACNFSKKSETKKCTVNGVEVDCEQSRNPVREPETVKVSINFSIDLQSEMDQLDILGNYYDRDYSRDFQECRVEVFSGTRLTLRRKEDQLTMKDGNEIKQYTRYGSDKLGYLGGWGRRITTSYGSRYEVLTIQSATAASLSIWCNFN